MKNDFKWLFYVVFFLLGVILVLIIVWPQEPPVYVLNEKKIDSLYRELEYQKTHRLEIEQTLSELTLKLELKYRDLTDISLRYEKIKDSLADFTYDQHVQYFLQRTSRGNTN